MTDQVTTQSGELPSVDMFIGAYDKTGYDQGYVSPAGGQTDDSRPMIVGRATPNSLVTLYDGDTPIGTAQVDGTGRFTFIPNQPLADGVHDISATATNDAGTSALTHCYAFTIDTSNVQPDQLGIDSVFENGGTRIGYMDIFGEGVIHDNRPTIEGTAKANSLVTVSDNGQVLGTAQADQWGHWSFTPNAALGQGNHHLSVTANGQVSDAFFDFTVAMSPAPALNYVLDETGAQQGYLQNGATTDDAHPTIQGSAGAGTMVTLYDNGQIIGSAQADHNGAWIFRPDAALRDGTHTFTAEANGQPAPWSFTVHVDTQASASSMGVAIGDAGGQPVVAESASDVHLSGNTDAHPPTPTLSINGADTPNGIVSDNGQIDYQSYLLLFGDAPPNTGVSVWEGNTRLGGFVVDATGHWDFRIPPGMATDDGEHHYTLRNNATGEVSSAFDITIGHASSTEHSTTGMDSTAPNEASLPFANITYASDNAGHQLHNGDATDDVRPILHGAASPNSTVTIFDYLTHEAIGVVTTNVDGEWSFSFTNALSSSAHTYYVSALGGQQSEPFKIDLSGATDTIVKPSITSVVDDAGHDLLSDASHDFLHLSHTRDNQPTLHGTATPGDEVTIVDSLSGYNVILGSVIAGPDGTWSCTPTPLSDGIHKLQAWSSGVQTDTINIAVDAHVAPTPVITHVYDGANGMHDVPARGTTTDTHVKLEGTAKADSTVTIYDGYRVIGTAQTSHDGHWTFDTPDLGIGGHTMTAKIDGQSSAQFSFIIAVPVVPVIITHVYDGANGMHDVPARGTTTDTHVKLEGTAKADSTVTIYDGYRVIGTAQTSHDGHWTFDTPDLGTGGHTMTAKIDGQSSAQFSFIVAAPVAPEPQPAITYAHDDVGTSHGNLGSGATTDDAHISLHGTGAPNSSVSIAYFYDDSDGHRHYSNDRIRVSVDGNGNWSYTPDTALANGAYEFYAASGTNNFSDAFKLVIDVTPPTIAHVYAGADGTHELSNLSIIHDTHLKLEGSATANSIVTIYDGYDKYGIAKVIGTAHTNDAGHWTFDTPELSAGVHDLTVVVDGLRSNEFSFYTDAISSTQSHADTLSLNDVLGSGEAELFAADHLHDNTQLSVHDVHAVDSTVVGGVNAITHDSTSLNTSLVLPHDQMHTHAMM